MGRKKKKPSKPWCWYCNREFDDEKILIQHQKAKHFKCHVCHKKLYTGPGLTIHCMQVHKEQIDKIPNALPNRNSVDIEIYGMQGIPEHDLLTHESGSKGGGDVGSSNSSIATASLPSVPPVLPTSGYPAAPGGLLPTSVPPGLPPMSGFPPGMGLPFNPMMPPPGLPPSTTIPGAPFINTRVPPPSLPPGFPPHVGLIPPPTSSASATSASNNNIPSQHPPPPVAFQMNLPRKPLFPAAASALLSQSAPSMNNGTTIASGASSISSHAVLSRPAVSGQQPPQTIPTPSAPTGSLVPPTNSTARIVHPAEDLSLEEHRARQLRYHKRETADADERLNSSSSVAFGVMSQS